MVLEKNDESIMDSKKNKYISITEEIQPEVILEAKMMTQKLRYFEHIMWTNNPIEKEIMLRKVEELEQR